VATDVERFDLLGFGVTLLGDTLDAGFSVQEWRAPPRVSGIPVHLHHRTDEGFYVVDGELALWLDGDALIRGPGSHVLVRAGRPHTFWNPSDFRPPT
jgi:mannose-6-phosphate isomerase-like protein (cupin superfamily)